MLKTFEASGKTVEEAIDKALLLANTTIENVDIEVLELGGKGVFGFGKKDARVRITQEVEDPQPEDVGASSVRQPVSSSARPPKPARRSEQRSPAQTEDKTPEPLAEDEAPVVKEMIRTRPGAEESKRGRAKDSKGGRNKEAAPKESQNKETDNKDEAPKEAQNKEQGRAKDKQRDKEYGNRQQREREKPAAAERERGERERDRERGYRVSEGEEAAALAGEATAFLNPIFISLKVEPEQEILVKDGILWLIFAGQGLGSLIGRRGETLNALQYLTNLAVNRDKKEHVRLVLDVEGYRAGREETLVALAKKMADKAVRSGRRVELEPMNPHERRIVHIALQNDKRVDTISQGEEPYRRVVINRRRHDGGHKRRGGGGGNKNDTAATTSAPEKMSLSQQLGQQFSEQMDSR